MGKCTGFRITIEPVMFFYMMSTFINYPAFQALTYSKVCNYKLNETFCADLRNNSNESTYKTEEDFVQSETSHWILIGNICSSVPSAIIVLLFLSPLADKFSRKFAILIVTACAVLSSVSNLLNSYYMNLQPAYLLIGQIINGLGGGYIGMMMAIYSYVTHIAKSEDRNVRVAIVESMIFLAGTIGVFSSGVLVDELGFIFTYSIVIGLQVVILIYVLVFLPDIKANEVSESEEGSGGCMVICSRACDIVQFVKKRREKGLKMILALMILVLMLLMVCFSGETDILYLYVTRKPLRWSTTLFGYLRGVENFMRGISLITILPILKYKVCLKDTTLIIIGLVSRITTYILFSFRSTETLFAGGVVSLFAGFPAAGIRATTSQLVDNDEHGKLFGLIATLESGASIVATLVFNEVYPLSLTFYPGFCFILLAAIVLICLMIFIWLHINMAPVKHYKNLELSDSNVSTCSNEEPENVTT